MNISNRNDKTSVEPLVVQRKTNVFVIANPGKVSDACEVDVCFQRH